MLVNPFSEVTNSALQRLCATYSGNGRNNVTVIGLTTDCAAEADEYIVLNGFLEVTL